MGKNNDGNENETESGKHNSNIFVDVISLDY